jgi:DNA-binding CsgD family transcriptional regulator
VNKLVLPYVDELKQAGLDAAQAACVDILESNLKHLISPFLERLGMRCANLTLREMRIADLIKSGKTTKEICHVLQMSAAAVNFHWNNIRKKLGLSNHKVNLAAYLSSL